MIKSLRRAIRKLKGREQAPPAPTYPADFSPDTINLVEMVQPYTMTSPERIHALQSAVEYIVDCGIQGDIVECGVWKGGSMMAVAQTLLNRNESNRHLYLYDTFEGMTEPTEMDRDHQGNSAVLAFHEHRETEGAWCFSPLDEVQQNLAKTGYQPSRIHFIKGKVEETIPGDVPERIALLRLDTDWYESTRHELDNLYPRLVSGGVLIIDDYGHWSGARRAVDEYFAEHQIRVLLHRVDYTARMCLKPAA